MENSNTFKFFIVDDDYFFATITQQHLNNKDYNDITYFSNGNECLENLHLNPDIIFLDHNMDDIKGFEVLKKIKRYNPNIYVVMISAQNDIQMAVDSLKYGAFDYVSKESNTTEKIDLIIEKIINIKKEMAKANPNLIQRLLFFM